jgi:ABC-type branched-subunit amino acid transport system permease subunit
VARGEARRASILPGAGVFAAVTGYVIAILHADKQNTILILFGVGVAAVLAASMLKLLKPIGRSFSSHETAFNLLAVLAMLLIAGVFRGEHFVLLLVVTFMLYAVASLGLTIQFGYAGVVNFAGASFFGIGAYTSAVLTTHTALPHLAILFLGGVTAALAGIVLLPPILRTSGHYAAVVTIAFALLFKSFIEVNDVLGGPQGIHLPSLEVLGWSFNDNITIRGYEISFYMNYFLLSLVLLIFAFIFVRRLERSWIGLSLDAIRLDETAASCFGLGIARWKAVAFLLGNFLIGLAGALSGIVAGFVAPSNFTFADSLILVSILLLGGIGNIWGAIVATAFVVIVPEKLQTIQEYRFLLYAVMVVLVLRFQPEGLLPRPVRRYFKP